MRQGEHQSGFGTIEVLLVVLVIAVLAVSGLVMYQRHKNTDTKKNTVTNPSQTTLRPQSNATTKTNAPAQVIPSAFVSGLLGTLASGDETKLEQLLTPAFKSFRQQNLATGHCNNPPTQSLTCDSLLDASAMHSFVDVNPTVTDFTDAQTGKIVTYQLAQGGSDPGTTYFTFYLLPHNNSWLLNDYRDVFVSKGTAYTPLPGEMAKGQ